MREGRKENALGENTIDRNERIKRCGESRRERERI